jgi:hypothetical protein
MWIFARRELRLGSTVTFLASAVWTFAGVHWQHLTGGSLTWVPFFYAPLMLFLWRHAERDRRLAVALGALIALTIYEGGVYPLAFAVVFLGAETLTRAWPPRRIPRIALLGLIVVNRTQNTFTLNVNVKRPARILLNTGYDKGWRTDVGTPGEQNKQLIVDLPPGRHRVHVKYWPSTLTAGFLLTALGMVGSVLFLSWESSRRRKAG